LFKEALISISSDSPALNFTPEEEKNSSYDQTSSIIGSIPHRSGQTPDVKEKTPIAATMDVVENLYNNQS
jgi:hypothetical protein